MPTILALDTSTQACSCALHVEGQIHEVFDIIPRQHATRLLPMIQALMSEHGLTYPDLDAVAYGQGPGSFTGLRIAAGVTQGIAFGAGLPVIPVSSLASLALQMAEEASSDPVFSCLDARIDEVYWGLYEVHNRQLSLLGSEGLCKPEKLPVELPGNPVSLAGVGSGLEFLDRMPEKYRELITTSRPAYYPRAGTIAELAVQSYNSGITQAPEEVNPVYLRDKVTHSH